MLSLHSEAPDRKLLQLGMENIWTLSISMCCTTSNSAGVIQFCFVIHFVSLVIFWLQYYLSLLSIRADVTMASPLARYQILSCLRISSYFFVFPRLVQHRHVSKRCARFDHFRLPATQDLRGAIHSRSSVRTMTDDRRAQHALKSTLKPLVWHVLPEWSTSCRPEAVKSVKKT